MHVSQHEPEQTGAFYVIGGLRFFPLGGCHQARVSIRVSNRGDLNINAKLAQKAYLAQHENVIDRRILAQQVCDLELAATGFHASESSNPPALHARRSLLKRLIIVRDGLRQREKLAQQFLRRLELDVQRTGTQADACRQVRQSLA